MVRTKEELIGLTVINTISEIYEIVGFDIDDNIITNNLTSGNYNYRWSNHGNIKSINKWLNDGTWNIINISKEIQIEIW